MTEKEKTVIRAIIGALRVKRDRFGRLVGYEGQIAAEAMRNFANEYSIPHGGYDRVDQATMILQAMIGDTPRSIMD